MLAVLRRSDRSLTIPYPPIRHSDSVNHGYVDLRRYPANIDRVPETRDWPELSQAIRALNSEPSHFQTLGCEISLTTFERFPGLTRKVTSYTDIAFHPLPRNNLEEPLKDLARGFGRFLAGRHAPRLSVAEFELQRTCYREIDLNGWSLALWISGFGVDGIGARRAWARGLELVGEYLVGRPL
jgi:hypothetical protein